MNPSLRVLVVEDEPDTGKTYAAILKYWGHIPVLAQDAVIALHAVDEPAPDVILLDLGLPHMDGLQLAKVIRLRWPYKPPVLIAVTGYGTTEDRRRSSEAGIDFHLLKPVELHELKCNLGRCRLRPI